MKKIAAAVFRAQCLSLMEEVRSTRQPIVITKRGKPVAKLVPIEGEKDDFSADSKGNLKLSAILSLH